MSDDATIRKVQSSTTRKTPKSKAKDSPTAAAPNESVVIKKYTPKQQAAIQLMEQDRLDEAIALLSKSRHTDTTGTSDALIGQAQYRQGNYGGAADSFSLACAKDPRNKEWAGLLSDATSNEMTGVGVEIVHNPFTKENLLAAPNPGPGITQVAQDPKTSLIASMGKNFQNVLRHTVGAIATAGVGFAERMVGGTTINLSRNPTGKALLSVAGNVKAGEVWTTWSRQHMMEAALSGNALFKQVGRTIDQLGQMVVLQATRDNLNARNLKDLYQVQGERSGYLPADTPVPPGVEFYRTADGSYNDLANPKAGAAGVYFGRDVQDLDSTRVDEANLMDPSPREVSREVLTRDHGFKEVPFLNMFAANWIQFMVHDWVSHGDINYADTLRIPLAEGDPLREKFHMTDMIIPRTATDPTRSDKLGKLPAFVNENTAWWDGSQIYGSNLETQNRLRSHSDGKMKVDAKGHLPIAADGTPDTGFRRNMWLGLEMLHDLFVREHNSVCDMLKETHPVGTDATFRGADGKWDDEKLFQVGRLITQAEIAKIHTVEWTPAILPNSTLTAGMNANWFGMANYETKDAAGRPVVTPWKPTDADGGGIVGNATDNHGVAYSLAEEFVSVYRLHSLLPDKLKLHRILDPKALEEVPLNDTRNKGITKILKNHDMADLLFSMGTEHPGQLVLNNYPKTLQELSIPGIAPFDLAAVDVLRDRERGVPRYNEFRRQLGLKPITCFEDLTKDPNDVAKLKKVYNNDIEKIDMLVGTLAETQRPENYGFGETMFQVFILNASRRLQADRFFTKDYDAKHYTQQGLDWIDRSNFKNILIRQYPELAGTALSNVNNAFEPWDTDKAQLDDPTRHPLDLARR